MSVDNRVEASTSSLVDCNANLGATHETVVRVIPLQEIVDFHNNSENNSILPCQTRANKANRGTKLYQLLDGDGDGKMIVSVYDSQQVLTPSARNRLTRFIIRQERTSAIKNLNDTEKLTHFKISSKRFQAWAQEIVETFPGERRETYYTPYCNSNGFILDASGKLWNHFNYIKSVMKDNCLLENFNNNETENNYADIVESEDLKLLFTKVHPWREVLISWNNTFALRRNILLQGKISTLQYLEKFACLDLQNAIELFELDFSHLYPLKSSELLHKWERARQYFIQRLLRTRVSDIIDSRHISLLETFSPDIQDNLILFLLPYIIPCGGLPRKRKTRKSKSADGIAEESNNQTLRRYSIEERRNAFIVHFDNALTVEEIIRNVDARRSSNRLSQQPVAVVVGSLVNPAANYVIVGNRVYETDSILKSVDIAFKICFALDCEFTPSAYSLWIFIQKSFFQIDSIGDRASCALNSVIGEVQEVIRRD